ncbi:MAG: signal peptide peptidase SppA [Chitinophagaceae bacterium]|nr:signal peptide peptidase SppA [Chitinophagaceae bacterium]MCW5928764.1 signal peptide peptidase SppA [Chitinophagaceae bacterium]
MRSFFKFFFASLLALVIFTILVFIIFAAIIGGLASSFSTDKVVVSPKSVLYIDLSKSFKDRKTDAALAQILGGDDVVNPTLYEAVRLIEHAQKDSAIRGIYLKCNGNANGFGTSEELRTALAGFKESNKFIIAYGDYITQKSYYVANVADRIYCNPKGMLEWNGFASQMMFLKNTLKKLEIEPQIFYAGKFKSATEPLREEKMTEANRLQTMVWLGDLYNQLLLTTSEARGIDTATLHAYADKNMLQTAWDAVKYNLVDGIKYDDEIKAEIREKLGIEKDAKIKFVQIGNYAKAVSLASYEKDKVAIVYAEGDIVYGGGEIGQVGSDEFRGLFSRLRTDKNVKAVVLRVNSPGGSSLASEIIWREAELLKKEGKPVVVSMGNLAASGGYYISSPADSIFAQSGTLTGSIGVFGILPNMEGMFKNKLGITFDEVKTAEYASLGSVARPLNEAEKKFFQASVDSVYLDFKTRVAEGRNKDMDYVDSIAQGRVWTGKRAVEIGLADKLGGLNDAISCAARMAELEKYSVREYPEPMSLFEMLKSGYGKNIKTKAIKEEIGETGFEIYNQLKRIKQLTHGIQARLPFEITVN